MTRKRRRLIVVLAGMALLSGAVGLVLIALDENLSYFYQPSELSAAPRGRAIRLGGSAIHPSMLWPLLVMMLGFKLYYVSLLLMRVKAELLAARLRARAYAVLDAS